jgi:hypothetical protein
MLAGFRVIANGRLGGLPRRDSLEGPLVRTTPPLDIGVGQLLR